MKIEELKVICDMVVKLTELRQKECKHLCVEHFAPDCFARLLTEYTFHKQGKVRYTP